MRGVSMVRIGIGVRMDNEGRINLVLMDKEIVSCKVS